jgi:hypothetical protein
MKKKKVISIGAHVITHLSPTFGLTIVSLINLEIASIAFTHPEGTFFPLEMNLRTGTTIVKKRREATIQSIKTCLDTEKLIPKIVGNEIMG